jgi:hypothetical protein
VAMSYPQIHWTPCDMPEVIKQIKVTPDTIIATTDYYNVFTDDVRAFPNLYTLLEATMELAIPVSI